jgi:hypothetical protein
MFPPKAGRTCKRLPVSLSISSDVQSAVSPVLTFAATRGINDLPTGVAPARTMAGFCSLITFARISLYESSLNFSRDASLQRRTLSAPHLMSSSASDLSAPRRTARSFVSSSSASLLPAPSNSYATDAALPSLCSAKISTSLISISCLCLSSPGLL